MRKGIGWLLGLLGVALALSPEAAARLKVAAEVRAQAEAAYERAYPDLPLWREAIRLGEEAARLDPEAPEVWRFLAEVYTETGWWIRAAEAWQRYLEKGGAKTPAELAGVYRNLGYLAYERGAFEEAIAWYRKALEANPEDAEAAAWLGRIHLELGRPKDALPFWEKAVALDPSPKNRYFLEQTVKMAAFGPEAVSAFYKGYAAYEKKDKEAALVFFRRAADLAPDWIEPRRWLGRIYLELGLPAEAERYWAEVAGRTGAADAKYFLKLAREAKTYGLAAARAFFRGVAAYERGDLEAARTAFEAAVRENPDYAKAWKWLGRVHYEAGRFGEAARAYERALELNPGDAQAKYFYRLAKRAAGE